MAPDTNPERYKNHRFPPEITSHAVVRVHGGWKGMGFSEARRDRADAH